MTDPTRRAPPSPRAGADPPGEDEAGGAARRLARAALQRLDPEDAHHLVLLLLRGSGGVGRLAARWWAPPSDPRLCTGLAGLELPNPIGLAAGADEDADLAPLWPGLGFGMVELGTVTPRPQRGNPRPRVFRLPEQRAVVNRLGFPSRGAGAIARRLNRLRRRGWRPDAAIGVNVGMNRDTPLARATEDYREATRRFAWSADYVTINVSSPNTSGLRSLQQPEQIEAIVDTVRAAAPRRPVLVKLSPDLEPAALDETVARAEAAGAAGFVATNTTADWDDAWGVGPGGLSGPPLFERALSVVRRVASRGTLPVVGVGGVRDPASVLAMLEAGASAVQLYTGLVYEGPGLVRRLHEGLADALEERGLASIEGLRPRPRDPAPRSVRP